MTDGSIPGGIEDLLELAQSEPARALRVGIGMLDRIRVGDHVARSQVYRALGVASRNSSDLVGSIDYGEKSVREATLAEDRRLRSLSLMSLAGSRTFMGENTLALEILDDASVGADPHLLAEIEFQRATVFGRMGEPGQALARYTAALPEFERSGDRHSSAMTLHNRAMVEISLGEIGLAEQDLLRARSLYDGRFLRAGVEHGLGVVAAMRGDIPAALSRFDMSKQIFTDVAESAFESQVSRCELLLSAGLFREAFELAQTVTNEMERVGLGEEEAEARLVAAQAAFLSEDFDRSASWAEQAARMFAAQDRISWAAIARLVGLQVRYESGNDVPGLLEEAHATAKVLMTHGQVMAARRARLLAGLIGARSGRGDRGVSDLAWVAAQTNGPIETRLQSRFATAVMRRSRGDERGADAAVRSGLRLLDQYQAAVGATDVRIGVERHGKALGEMGLSLALESGKARRVFRWVELRRGRALLHRPVVPPMDEGLGDLLTELRLVSNELRTAEGQEVTMLLRRQRLLQDKLRDRSRLVRGGQAIGTTPTGLESIVKMLGDKAMVQFGSIDGRLWAVTVRAGRFRMVDLAGTDAIESEAQSLRFSMRRLARGRGSLHTAQEIANRLDHLLLAPLQLGDRPAVIVPTSGLHALPWWALPGLQRRSFVISPSAALWLRGQQPVWPRTKTLLAAGPDLELSDIEARELARLYPDAVAMSSTSSTVDLVLTALEGARVAHIASHAFFQFENPMFSSLRLADGDLNVYDIERLGSAPDLVVLSACDSGFTDTHPGEELMGLSSALLSMGTRSIVASVGLVPDSHATKDLMVALHRGLVAGLSPSVALHQAQIEVSGTPEGYVAASSFICIGAG
jgi:tetratricopeptide (TPR) repeat protein